MAAKLRCKADSELPEVAVYVDTDDGVWVTAWLQRDQALRALEELTEAVTELRRREQ